MGNFSNPSFFSCPSRAPSYTSWKGSLCHKLLESLFREIAFLWPVSVMGSTANGWFALVVLNWKEIIEVPRFSELKRVIPRFCWQHPPSLLLVLPAPIPAHKDQFFLPTVNIPKHTRHCHSCKSSLTLNCLQCISVSSIPSILYPMLFIWKRARVSVSNHTTNTRNGQTFGRLQRISRQVQLLKGGAGKFGSGHL